MGIYSVANHEEDDMKKKYIRIISLLVLLIVTIYVGIYMMTDHTETETVNELVSENEETLFSSQFHYRELGREDEAFPSGQRKYFSLHNEYGKLMINDKKAVIVALDDGEVLADVEEDLWKLKGFYIENNGNYWTVDYDENQESLFACHKSPNGEVISEMQLESSDKLKIGEYFDFTDLVVKDGYIYILASINPKECLFIYNKDGKLLKEYPRTISFDVDEEGNYLVHHRRTEESPSNSFEYYDIKSGEIIKQHFFEGSFPNLVRFTNDCSSVIAASEESYLIDINNDMAIRELFDFGVDSTFLLDELSIRDVVIESNGDIHYFIYDYNNPYPNYTRRFITSDFLYVEGERPERERILTITVPYKTDFLSAAITRYEMSHPTEFIEYDYAYDNREQFLLNAEEYSKKLALRIIGNDVGDIVQTGGTALRYWDLAKTDVFADLEPYLTNDSVYNVLNKSVLEGIRIDGKIKSLPVIYTFYQNAINREVAESLGLENLQNRTITWSEVLSWVDLLEGESSSYGWVESDYSDRNQLALRLEDILVCNMPDLIDHETKNVDLHQEWFIELMRAYKNAYTSTLLTVDNEEYSLENHIEGVIFNPNWNSSRRFSDLLANYKLLNDNHPNYMVVRFSGEENTNNIAYSRFSYSMNERSNNKEKAWEFLSFLMSEEVQVNIENEGTPINQLALERIIDKSVFQIYSCERKELSTDLQVFIDAYLANSRQVDYMYDLDVYKMDIVKEINRYVNNEISLDEALTNAENTMIIRLNE